jgi:hypothetical protein
MGSTKERNEQKDKSPLRTLWYSSSFLVLVAGLTFAPALDAKGKKTKTPASAPKDEIQVVGHVPLTDGPVRRFLVTQHFSSYYLYAERDAGRSVTLIDVTNTNRPAILADMSYAPNAGSGSLMIAAGTAALVSTESATPPPTSALQTIRIMDLSDPQSPKVAREFTGVTAVSRDDRRGLVFVADGDGIWILQQHFALDPEVEKAYDDYIRYAR